MKPMILISSGHEKGERSVKRSISSLYSESLFITGLNSAMMLGGDENELAERFDGLLLSGGGDISPDNFMKPPHPKEMPPDHKRDAEEFALLQAFCAKRKPVLAICRGIQLINVMFGGDILQHIENHNNKSHYVNNCENSVLYRLYGEKMEVNSYHHQAIGRIAPSFTAISYADDGTIEAIKHKTLPILGVQWHPERMVKGICMDTPKDQTELFTWFTKYSVL